MNNYTMDCYEMKREIFTFSKKISEGLNKKKTKFVSDIQYGLSKGKSCLISEISRSLNEDIKIKNINFRKTFIEEYANLFNNKGIDRNKVIQTKGVPINIEVSASMTSEEIKRYIKNCN